MASEDTFHEKITSEGLEELRAEIAELEGPARNEMSERIKAARELGDLSENADYHTAKEDQAHLETKILRLKDKLAKAVEVDVDENANAFAFGRTAEVLDETAGKTHTWTLVGRAESDFGNGKLSVESPVGRVLQDMKVGDSASVDTPGGERTYKVAKLVD